MKTKIFIIIIGLLILNHFNYATNISGNINTSSPWTISGSPYNIVGTAKVLAGQTLTIKEGVVVNFHGESGLIIQGTLRVNMDEGSTVYFQDSESDTPTSMDDLGGWIRFENSSTDNEIHNSTFRYLACDPGDASGGKSYGAIHIISSSVKFYNCTIQKNGNHMGTTTYNNYGNAGAVGIGGSSSCVDFYNTDFLNNVAKGTGGGAIYGLNCVVNIDNCEFTDNDVNFENGTILQGGGAIYTHNSYVNIIDSDFKLNEALNYNANGGAILFESNIVACSLFIDRCTFIENSVGDDGGAICLTRQLSSDNISPVTIKNSLITGNFSGDYFNDLSGGGIRAMYAKNLSLIYNTISYNNETTSGKDQLGDGISIKTGSTDMLFRNNIVNKNGYLADSDDNIYVKLESINAEYSNLGDCRGVDTYNCNSGDPLFNSGLHLQINSPCINTGYPNPTEPEYDLENKLRPKRGGFDMGAYEFGDEFLITIISDNIDFCANDDPTVNLSFEGMPDFLIESLNWDFGDGSPIVQNQFTTNHTYPINTSSLVKQYTVTLTMTVINGDIIEDEQVISIYPTPQFSAMPTTIRQGQSVRLSGTSDVPFNSWQLFYYNTEGQVVELSSGGYGTNFSVNPVINDVVDGEIEIYLDYNYGDITCRGETIIHVCSDDCIYPFAPVANQKYILSAWISEDMLPEPQSTFSSSGIQISYLLNDETTYEESIFKAKGQIIDGWQRIEESFTVHPNAIDITVSLINSNTDINSYFDDIRIFPVSSTMKSFVYDPVNLRFVAELDENNYTTYYEYDKEGKLTRVKKETEKGIVTIQESRSHMSKHSFD